MENRTASMSKEETKILSHSFTFGKTKERFSSSRLVYHEVEKTYNLKISATRGSKKHGTGVSYKAGES